MPCARLDTTTENKEALPGLWPSPLWRAVRPPGPSLTTRVALLPRCVHLHGRDFYAVWGSDLRLTDKRGVRGVPLLPSSYGFSESPTHLFRVH